MAPWKEIALHGDIHEDTISVLTRGLTQIANISSLHSPLTSQIRLPVDVAGWQGTRESP